MPVAPAKRVSALSGEGAFEVFVAARRLEDAGRHVVHLEIGEPDGATPPHVLEAGVRALHDGHTRYVNPAGLPALRDAIAASLPWRGVRGASVENVVVVPGAKPMVFYALRAIAELALRHDLTVISDEVYGRIRYDRPADTIAALPGMLERTVIVDSFSKSYGMTGWRLGFGVLPAPLVERVTMLVINGTSCTPPFVQLAGLAALTGPQDAVTATVANLERRRDWLVDGLNGLPGFRCTRPDGAFYAFPDVRQIEERAGLSTEQLAARLLESHGLAVLPGTGFGPGGAGHLRLSFASSPANLDLALERLREFVSDLAVAAVTDGGVHVSP